VKPGLVSKVTRTWEGYEAENRCGGEEIRLGFSVRDRAGEGGGETKGSSLALRVTIRTSGVFLSPTPSTLPVAPIRQ
jgi:hypothetical protein